MSQEKPQYKLSLQISIAVYLRRRLSFCTFLSENLQNILRMVRDSDKKLSIIFDCSQFRGI